MFGKTEQRAEHDPAQRQGVSLSPLVSVPSMLTCLNSLSCLHLSSSRLSMRAGNRSPLLQYWFTIIGAHSSSAAVNENTEQLVLSDELNQLGAEPA